MERSVKYFILQAVLYLLSLNDSLLVWKLMLCMLTISTATLHQDDNRNKTTSTKMIANLEMSPNTAQQSTKKQTFKQREQ